MYPTTRSRHATSVPTRLPIIDGGRPTCRFESRQFTVGQRVALPCGRRGVVTGLGRVFVYVRLAPSEPPIRVHPTHIA